MIPSNYNKCIKSPKLLGVIVESILIYCINESSISELMSKIQKILPLSITTIKNYLFFLIDYELISYNGKEQIYQIEKDGFDLLYKINREKMMRMVNDEDFVIIIDLA
jgi:hypothetical protein